MSTLAEIYLNYNTAINQASELDEVARRLNNAADKTLDGILGDIHRAWRSDSSPQYIRKGEKIENNIHITAKNLSNIANAIRTIARRILNAELDAWRIANERKA